MENNSVKNFCDNLNNDYGGKPIHYTFNPLNNMFVICCEHISVATIVYQHITSIHKFITGAEPVEINHNLAIILINLSKFLQNTLVTGHNVVFKFETNGKHYEYVSTKILEKISYIKIVRDATNLPLKECKNIVDAQYKMENLHYTSLQREGLYEIEKM